MLVFTLSGHSLSGDIPDRPFRREDPNPFRQNGSDEFPKKLHIDMARSDQDSRGRFPAFGV